MGVARLQGTAGPAWNCMAGARTVTSGATVAAPSLPPAPTTHQATATAPAPMPAPPPLTVVPSPALHPCIVTAGPTHAPFWSETMMMPTWGVSSVTTEAPSAEAEVSSMAGLMELAPPGTVDSLDSLLDEADVTSHHVSLPTALPEVLDQEYLRLSVAMCQSPWPCPTTNVVTRASSSPVDSTCLQCKHVSRSADRPVAAWLPPGRHGGPPPPAPRRQLPRGAAARAGGHEPAHALHATWHARLQREAGDAPLADPAMGQVPDAGGAAAAGQEEQGVRGHPRWAPTLFSRVRHPTAAGGLCFCGTDERGDPLHLQSMFLRY